MIGLVGDGDGFSKTGGVRTLAKLLTRRLVYEKINYLILSKDNAKNTEYTSLIVIGCSSPWAYGLALKTLLKHPLIPIHWIPCFHPPRFVRHRNKARLAQWALFKLQKLGVQIYALSQTENKLLNNGNCRLISLPFEGEDSFSESESKPEKQLHDRPYDLVFLGRPTKQKGWPQYLNLVTSLGVNCLALAPNQTREEIPPNLTIEVGLSNTDVSKRLLQCKLLILPSNYESFGFAQAEALLAGCCVPVLGEWPLWLDVPELDWRLMTASQIAQRIHSLLGQPSILDSLQNRQLQAWMHRPERESPRLPSLHG